MSRWIIALLATALFIGLLVSDARSSSGRDSAAAGSDSTAKDLQVMVEFRVIEMEGAAAKASDADEGRQLDSLRLLATVGREAKARLGSERELRSRVRVYDGIAEVVAERYFDGTEIVVSVGVTEDRKYAWVDGSFRRSRILRIMEKRHEVYLPDAKAQPLALSVEVPEIDRLEAETRIKVPDGGTALFFGETEGPKDDPDRKLFVLVSAQIVDLAGAEREAFGQPK